MERWNGDRLRKLRKDAGFTQQELATLIGCHRVTLARAEAGKVSLPWRYADWLDVLDEAVAVCLQHRDPDGKPWALRGFMSHGKLPWRWYEALRLVYTANVE